ncbi:lantibiotic dehydratase family protein [Ascidiimonas sp. W6]|uniref:lantibiotic dehydratase family protein n=1 Tax=Ascidiimonas meishanensis TaxID=3128903 RepID=UPI0030ED7801
MKKNTNPYESFDHFVLRTPLLPLNFFQSLTADDTVSQDQIKKVFNDSIVREAIFLASPSLYFEAVKWAEDPEKNDEKLAYSILKYISRMSSRCTPFGLFAGCALGSFIKDEENNCHELTLKAPKENKRHTRLDMNYLVALSQDLIKSENIRKQLLFYPNSSIYRTGDQLRYVEYKYINSKRHHHIVAVDHTDYLQVILDKSKNGAYLHELVETLVNDEITAEEASEFINELVLSQLLISELEPSVSGPEFLQQILKVLKKLKGTEDIIKFLEKADQKIATIDQKIGNKAEAYLELSEDLKKLQTTFELKFLFQTDMELSPQKAVLNTKVIDSIKKGISFLNQISIPSKETTLSKFKDAFYERYEEREVLLANALDIEIGVGYRQNQGSGDVNPLVDDIMIPPRPNESGVSVQEIKWNSVQAVIQKKLIQAFRDDAYIIKLTSEDFKNFTQGWDDLPDTISTMIEIVNENGEEKLKFSGAGGSSAANLLGRFCHGDEALNAYTQKIVHTEAKINKDKLLAEIVHLPESRVGNILMRPAFRKYEIPYLAKSILKDENQLTLDDLMISVKQNRHIYLRSKKYDKEVIPHLTNAHNFSFNSLPIYHFLCDLQTQNIRSGIGFNAGPFEGDYEFVPRFEFENLILSDATWNIRKKSIEPLIKVIKEDLKLKELIKEFTSSRKIPQYVMLADGDNELLINFGNLTSVRMLLDTVKKRESFKITEFLFNEESVVKNENDYYTNQIVLSFYNQNKLNSQNTENTNGK